MEKVSERVTNLFGEENSLNLRQVEQYIKQLDRLINPMLNGTLFNPTKINISTKDFNKSNSPKKSFLKLQKYFGGCINWRSTKNNYNITPPAPIPTIAACAVANSINQTMVSDIACGNFAAMELNIIQHISKIVGWNSKEASGIFTFGGTGTNMYGCKIGINKCNKNFALNGVKNTVVFDSDQAHSSHKTIVDWLGVGLKNNIILKTKNDLIDMDELNKLICKEIENGKQIGCINLSGGTTYNGQVDEIKKCSKLIDLIVKKYNLDYRPHLHIDSVIGWVYLLFKDYDFKKNKLNFTDSTLKHIKESTKKISELKYADSFGVDFHKTGFSTYSSSLFMLKNRHDWKHISKGALDATHQAFELGNYSPGKFTLETSRGVNGPVSAYISLITLGKEGFQESIGILKEFTENLRTQIKNSEEFSVCNDGALGWATLIMLNPIDEKVNFEKLITNKNTEYVKTVSSLQKEFFDYIYFNQKDFEWYVSFSKSYRKNNQGVDLAALKVFPMSPLIKKSDSTKYFNWLLQKRKEFYEYKNKV